MSGRHRGPHPDDAVAFGPDALPRLRLAAEEVAWMLGRGYAMTTAVTVAGNHHALDERQRRAVQRASCADARRLVRAQRALAPGDVAGRAVRIDGFNLLVTLESALGGAVTHRGLDGALRDLAGLRGSYHVVEETAPALDLAADVLASLGAARAEWLLDAPVSNSGRVKALITERAARWPLETDVALVPDPDATLAGGDAVVSSDALVLDRCASWVNLAAWVVAERVPGAWVVALEAR